MMELIILYAVIFTALIILVFTPLTKKQKDSHKKMRE